MQPKNPNDNNIKPTLKNNNGNHKTNQFLKLSRYNLQLDVLHQLSHRIEDQLRSHESRLASLPRNEASALRTTHIKLNRDYRLVEQQFKNLCLDVKRKRSMAEVMQRESARDENNRENTRLGEGSTTEEGMRWQMQIQEDVSTKKQHMMDSLGYRYRVC